MTITAIDDVGFSNETFFELIVENVAPDISADSDPVTVMEGDTASNDGFFFDPGQLDDVSITASIGAVE